MENKPELGFLGSLLLDAHTIKFNLFDVVLLITCVQCMLFAIIFVSYKNNKPSHKVFTAFMASIGLMSFNFFLTYYAPSYNYIYENISANLLTVTTVLFFLPGVLLYEFVRTLTYGNYHIEKFHYIPFAIFIILLVWHPVARHGGWFAEHFWRDHIFIGMVGFAVNAVFGALSVYHVKRYSAQLKEQTSNIDTVNFSWLKIVTIGFLVIWLLEVLAPLSYNKINWVLHNFTTHLKNIGVFVLVGYVVFSELIHSNSIQKIPFPEDEDEVDEEFHGQQQEIDLLKQAMESHKYYRKANLTIEAFAESVNLPVREVSQILNQYYKKNFYEFVNEFRIDEAKILLKDPEWRRKSIQLIYEEVGFNSKSSFNTLFKKYVETTPSAYRKSPTSSVKPSLDSRS